jgi:hypothetical protein
MKAFGGGAGNQTKCASCTRTVYPNDPQITLDGVAYHKECAKCVDCKCQITLSNFCKSETTLYCKTHYFKRFKEEGGYIGGEKYSKASTGVYGGPKDSFIAPADKSKTSDSPNQPLTEESKPSDNDTEVPSSEETTTPTSVEETPASITSDAVEASAPEASEDAEVDKSAPESSESASDPTPESSPEAEGV